MKIKTLAILIGLAVLFGALAYYSAQKKKTLLMPAAIGSKVFPNLDINRVGKLVVTSQDGVTTVAKSKEKWVVASRFNYPANFDKVADMIRELSELKVGQTVNALPSQLGAFNLVSPVVAGTNRPANTGTFVELRDEKDGLLASLLIGKGFKRQPDAPSMEMMMNFGGYSEGQYIQTYDGKAYLVSRTLDRLTESAKTWLADDFINVSSADLKEINVSGPDRAPIKLLQSVQAVPVPQADPSARPTLARQAPRDGDSFTLADLRPEEGTLESAKVNQVIGALNRLGFDDVADPALTLKETGFDRPIVFRATTKDSLIYVLQVGNVLTNDTFDRYIKISVTNETAVDQREPEKPKEETGKKEEEKAPVKKSASEQVAELNGKFGSWIYVIKSYRAEPILLTRNDLIKKPELPKTKGEQANGPVVNAEEAGNKPPDDKSTAPVKNAPKK